MKHKVLRFVLILIAIPIFAVLDGCGKVQAQADASAAEAPPAAKVVGDVDLTLFAVDHPDQFPLVAATEHPTTSELVVRVP